MQTAFESRQALEITSDDRYNETMFSIGLRCTASSYAGCFDPSVAGEPPSGPEFEVTTIQVLAPQVKHEIRSVAQAALGNATYGILTLEPKQFEALVGEEIAHDLYDRAMEEAAESGEF